MTKKQERAEAILRYGFKLKRVFPAVTCGPVELYETLRRIEAEAHRLAERECCEQLPEGYSERKEASIVKRLDALLGFKAAKIPVFLSGDPRGYALKIDSGYVREHDLDIHRDWGGYGILAPDLD